MAEYRRQVGEGTKQATIEGSRCDRCGFTVLKDDDRIWSAVGL